MSDGAPAGGWTKVAVESGPAAAEEIAIFLTELTGTGAETRHLSGGGGAPRELVVGYLPRGAGAAAMHLKLEKFLARIAGDSPGEAPRLQGPERVDEEDWHETWKRRFAVAKLTRRLTVRPSWRDYTPEAGERVVEIDPAMAFGTGLHESTRLVLQFVEELYPDNGAGPQRVLDVGTGTGILAMACALLGARSVLAIDNDPLAVEAAGRNVVSNGLEETVTVSGGDLSSLEGRFELVTANIVHDTIVALSRELAARLTRGGSLVCAGILAGDQEKSLAKVLGRLGLKVTAAKREKEWVALQVKLFS